MLSDNLTLVHLNHVLMFHLIIITSDSLCAFGRVLVKPDEIVSQVLPARIQASKGNKSPAPSSRPHFLIPSRSDLINECHN